MMWNMLEQFKKERENSLEKSGKGRERETHVNLSFPPSFQHGAQGK
jgi:hypothetical protein